MEQILNLQHISYTYHTLEGETPALSDISFSLNKGGICRHRGTFRLWKIHAAFSDLRSFALQ